MSETKNPDASKQSPKHGSSPQSDLQNNESKPSVSQADGTAAGAPRGETQAQPNTQKQAQPNTQKQKNAPVQSQTPEAREGQINPSAPNDATSIDSAKDLNPHASDKGESDGMPANTTRDSSGEVGEPTGEGTLDAPKENEQPDKNDRTKKDEEEAA